VSAEEGFVACYIICSGLGIPLPYANITSVAFGNRLTATQAGNGYTASLDRRGYAVRRLKGDWEAVTGTAGVEYRPFDDTLTFAKYSRGYKAGGFNNLGFVLNPYTDAEFVDSYEAGWKQAWADYGLTTNAAVFLYSYTDSQAPLTIVNNDGGIRTTSTAFVNLPEVQTTGFELEGNWSPIDALNIGFTYAYLNTEITESGVYIDPTRDDRCVGATPTSRVTSQVQWSPTSTGNTGRAGTGSGGGKVGIGSMASWIASGTPAQARQAAAKSASARRFMATPGTGVLPRGPGSAKGFGLGTTGQR
jgi:outer membrane receptor protein involved in Fe transport